MWREVAEPGHRGVVLAGSQKQEWLLPWWLDNYRKHNSFPVTFVDLGLSEEGKEFCRSEGDYVDLSQTVPRVGEKKDASPERGVFWEEIYRSSDWWEKRKFWHKKPFALLQTPYRSTLWLDLDCEVLGSLTPLFEKIEENDALLICPEPKEAEEFDRIRGHIFPDETLFNSGVIGFRRGSSYIAKWAEATVTDHAVHLGDQNLLSRLIYTEKWKVQLLDSLYNWRRIDQGYHPEMKIVHWVGEAGKFFISLQLC